MRRMVQIGADLFTGKPKPQIIPFSINPGWAAANSINLLWNPGAKNDYSIFTTSETIFCPLNTTDSSPAIRRFGSVRI